MTTYLTTAEVAELKGCSLRYVQQLVHQGKLEHTEKEDATNNRIEYLVPLTALSKKLQLKWEEQQRRKLGLEPAVKASLKKAEKELNDDFNSRQITLSDLSYEQRDEIAFWSGLIQEWLAERERNGAKYGKCKVDEMFIGAQKLRYPDLNISADILYRKYKAYKNGDLEALIDHRGGHNKGKTSIPKRAWDYFLYIYLQENQRTVSRCYTKTLEYMREYYPEEYADIPSERTFRRQAEKIPFCETALMRRGKKYFDDHCMPYVDRIYDDLHANDIWVADNYTCDFTSKGENGKLHRLYLTMFMDAFSGMAVGWHVTEDPSVSDTLLAFRNGVLRCGFPQKVYMDNGSEFTGHDLAGRGHRTRKSWNKEEQPATIMERIGIGKIFANPRNADAKAVERMFRTFKEHFAREIPTYLGGNVLERPESYKYKIKHGIVPEDQQIRALIDAYMDGEYNQDPYGGKAKGFEGMTRMQVWNESMKKKSPDEIRRPASEHTLDLLLKRISRAQKIKRNGVFITICGDKLWYYGEETLMHINETVYIRYDPSDPREARIYDMETDKYLWTWKLADELMMDYITENIKDFEDMGKRTSAVRKAMLNVKNGIIGAVDHNKRIDELAIAVERFNRKIKESNGIIQPTSYTPVFADEEIEEHPQLRDITQIASIIELMSANAQAARKDG